MEDHIEWFERAKKDFKAAKDSFNTSNFEWSCFQSQQSAEKALKALQIKKTQKFSKIHDLVLLARKLNAPGRIINICSFINPSYTDTRYPDLSRIYTDEDAQNLLNKTKELLEWIEKNL